ncbi:signal recognition particle subunit [Coemansia spiralis]|uniref:Signal recognition particle subunit n=2 Tax=Coemansia TaxID=4863 RepID=A0A9W8KXW7_9FUNG|nr:signal recognition particle, SRP19 subunit [Coemansia spiralis]KAJ1996160.1 signal recognition particle subunit [Coemansia umbellata]KAJ2626083.1 signal recognition particle subunit [Coemansia sp. RSA 1358]KAJ2676226.1 signal recognition particle subunit [Coemansia spiralis]
MSAQGRGKQAELDVDDMDFPLPDAPETYDNMRMVNDASQFKTWVCLYPLYFDKARSTRRGRKVALELAVESPHARQLSQAAKKAGFNVCYEPTKSHPRDFFTPGRVRVQLFVSGRPFRQDVPDRRVLLKRVAELLDPTVPREKEPTLQDLIDSGAMPQLPGMAEAPEEEASVKPQKPQKPQKASKKKGKANKNII